MIFLAVAFAVTNMRNSEFTTRNAKKVNYLNQRSEDGGGLGYTRATYQGSLSSKTKSFLRESSVNPNNLP